MSSTNTQKLLTAVAKCNYNRSTREYAVHWEINVNNFNTATVEEIVQQIEKEYPKTNSSLFRKEIEGRRYLVVGTIWHPVGEPDEYILKFYSDDNAVLDENGKSVHPLLPFLFILLIVAVGFIGYRYGNAVKPPDNTVENQLSELANKIETLSTSISNVESGTGNLSKEIDELKTELQKEVKPKMDSILLSITNLKSEVENKMNEIIASIESNQKKILDKIKDVDKDVKIIKTQIGIVFPRTNHQQQNFNKPQTQTNPQQPAEISTPDTDSENPPKAETRQPRSSPKTVNTEHD
ncbi:MAG: hypothetical protein LBU65_16930 [Planctomycetaceae bacterium]|jgi:chaperonin cofactor prefoldin|nr:hypothetical protein [Planctomycetaceae bacterium]